MFMRFSQKTIPAGVLFVVPLTLAVQGCDGNGPPTPDRVVVTPATATLTWIGETVRLTGEVVAANGSAIGGAGIASWSADPTSVCTVNQGVVTAAGDGTCKVTARSNTSPVVDGEATVTVSQAAAALSWAMQLAGARARETLPTSQVCVEDARGTTVAGDDATVVSVAIGSNPDGGTLTGTATGTVSSGCADFDDLSIDVEGAYTLMASASGLPDEESNSFDVGANPTSVTMSCPAASLESLGETAQCTAQVWSDGRQLSNVPLIWGSDPTSVCAVDDAGLVTAVADGDCTVTATETINNQSGSDVVTVEQKAVRLTIVPPDFVVLAIGGQATLTVEVFDALDSPIVSPTVAVQCAPGGVVSAAGLDLTGAAAGVTDCEVTSGSAGDTARIAVVEQKGFAAIFTTDTNRYRISATVGGAIQVDLWMMRPGGGDGDLGSIQGSLSWDASVLSYVSSAAVESGWAWVPNETNVGTGTLKFATFSATGTANTFVLARVTFTPAVGNTDLGLSVSTAGDALGTNITAWVEAVETRVTAE